MRNFITFLIALGIFLSYKAQAQIKPAQAQYLQEKGFLVNPSFEQGYKGWTIAGCSKSLVSEIPFLNKSLKLTCVGESFSIKQEDTSHIELKGQQGIYDLQVKADFQGTRVSFLGGGTRYSEINVNPRDGFTRVIDTPFTVNGNSNGIEIFSDSIVTGEIIIDNVKLGLSSEGYLKEDLDDTPVGTVLAYSSEVIPESYLLANGDCKSRAEYSALFDVLGVTIGTCDSGAGANTGFLIPDLRDKFLKGLTGGRVAFDTQADSTAKNGLSVSNNTVTSGSQNANHNHADGLGFAGSSGQTRYGLINLSGDSVMNDYGANAYAATYSTYASTSLNLQNHQHSVTSNVTLGAGDSKTQPENTAVVYIIKAKGRSPRTIVSLISN